jgi:hypothetical protein
MFFPLLAGLLRGIDVLEALAVDELDGVADPASLNFNAGRTVGENYFDVSDIVEGLGRFSKGLRVGPWGP